MAVMRTVYLPLANQVSSDSCVLCFYADRTAWISILIFTVANFRCCLEVVILNLLQVFASLQICLRFLTKLRRISRCCEMVAV
jgi:hypothetical protein